MVRKRIRIREESERAEAFRGSRPPDRGVEGEGTDGFSLSFVGGRGILTLKNSQLGQAIQADLLELIIADLTFPFDITGGIRGLRHRRHRLGRLHLSISLDGIAEIVTSRLQSSTWSDLPTISFEKDHIAVLVKYGPEHTRIPLSFRLLPFVGDAGLDFIVDEPRAYGPLPASPLLVAVASVQEMTGIQPKGLTTTLPEPVRMALFTLLPPRGWRIPDHSRTRLTRFELMPDRLLLEYCDLNLLEDATANPFGLSEAEQFKKLKKIEENRIVADGDILLTDGQIAGARSAYGKLLSRDSENPTLLGRLATLDITTPELMATACSQVEQARQQHPERTDLAAIACHGAALAENIEAEKAALETLLENANSLERYASGLRIGTLLLDSDPKGASAALKKSLAARREDRTALSALLDAQIRLQNRDAALQLIPRFIAAHKLARERTDAYIQAGNILLEKLDDPKEAVRNFERATMNDPGNLEAQWRLAEALSQSGELQRAIFQFGRLERLFRQRGDMKGAARAIGAIGKIWLDRGEPILAIQRLREATEFDKDALDVRIHLAEALAKIKRMAEAANEYETALGHAGSERNAMWWGEAALELAHIYFHHLGDADGAEPWARAGAEFEKLKDKASTLLVTIWEHLGKHACLRDALATRVKTLESGDRQREMLIELGNLELREFSRPLEALKWFKMASGHGKDSIEAKRGTDVSIQALGDEARQLLQFGKYEEARHLFSSARRECGGLDEQGFAIGEAEACLELGDHEGALKAAMTAQEGSTYRAQGSKLAAQAFLELDAPDEAVRQLEQAAEHVETTESADLYWSAGAICQKNLGDNAQAARFYKRVVAIDPSHPEADGRLRQIMLEMNDGEGLAEHRLEFLEILVENDLAANREDAAVSHLSEMVSIDPTNGGIWQRLVSVLERRGKWNRLAEEILKRIGFLENPEDLAEMHFEMATLMENKLGDEFGAQKYYDRVLEIAPNHEGALRSCCHLAYKRQKWGRLDELLGRLQSSEPDPVEELWRANAAEHMGRRQEAASLYKLLVNRNPEDEMAAEGLERVKPDSSLEGELDFSLEGKLSEAFDRLRKK